MSRQPVAQKQLLTLRQALIIIGILALMFFAFKYGQNVLRYRELQSELSVMDAHVGEVETERTQIDRAFDESLSPANVEEFVRRVLGWVRPGEEVIVSVGGNDDVAGESTRPADASAPEEGHPATEHQPNWRLWLNMLTNGE
jgi:cell division protein FtsB